MRIPAGLVLLTALEAALMTLSGEGLFDQPTDVVVSKSGDIFVTDGQAWAWMRPGNVYGAVVRRKMLERHSK